MSRRLAVITGGTSGIGLGIAQKLIQNFDLALVYGNNHERAEQAKNLLEQTSSGAKVQSYSKDLLQLEEIPSLIKKITEDFAIAPSVLVNSAGRLRDGLFQSSKMQDHEDLIREHLLAPMALCHAVVKGMSVGKFGRIIHLSSISADFAKRGQTNYAAAKGGIESFTRTLALEVAHRGITVNAIAPGLIETPMTQQLVEKIQSSNEGIRSRIPVGRLGTPADIGAVVAFLCSDDASYITGTTITVDGGRSLGDPQS
ncbi:MAG TPA: SDR family oxidoreductase [Pseudobdellovibrionaceae bacterium]|jgi:3-oxoacyl-[acyl-carrier protein] reductase